MYILGLSTLSPYWENSTSKELIGYLEFPMLMAFKIKTKLNVLFCLSLTFGENGQEFSPQAVFSPGKGIFLAKRIQWHLLCLEVK